jgi:hypothetical protein
LQIKKIKMKKVVLTIAILISITFTLKAQNYYTGVGLRGGLSNGITVKHFVSETNAVEGIIASRWGGVLITGLFEFENEFNTPGLTWFYGAGGHVGIWNTPKNASWWVDGDVSSPIVGVDGIIGIEYTFDSVPISLSVDWKPAINLIGYTGAWADSGAFSIRYVF